MRTIAISNQKGGCGKTTTTVNLGAALAAKGKRTLVVDLDPQGHTTIGFGQSPEKLDETVFNVLTHFKTPISKVTIETNIDSLILAPSNILLAGAEEELGSTRGREFVLSEKLNEVNDQYDYCLIDCPPALGLLTLNALVAARDVVVPVQAHYYAMEGLRQLLDTISVVRERFDPCSVSVLGLLLTFVQDRTSLSAQIERQMREYFGDLVFHTVIHLNTKLAEAPGAGEPVLTYAPTCKGAVEYTALIKEVIDREISGNKKESYYAAKQ